MKCKQLLTILLTGAVVLFFAMGGLLLPDRAISSDERRALAQLPSISAEAVFSAEYMTDLEEYLLDQIPLRDTLRGIKATFAATVLGMRDVNGLYEYQGSLYKIEYPTDEKQIAYTRAKLEEIYDKYLRDAHANVYYAIIPDKDYDIREESGRPGLDYDALKTQMQGIRNMTYIDLFDVLKAEDYYRTDTHWRQSALRGVVERLAEKMDFADALPQWEEYTQTALSDFRGVYLGQSARPIAADTLVYLESEGTRNATVTSVEAGEMRVYQPERFTGTDGYDVYLGGAQALMTVENPDAKTDRTLVLFRDSFGSSLAPLLVDTYKTITLVDLRYCSSRVLGDYIDFSDSDVLFLYSTSLVNHGRLLK